MTGNTGVSTGAPDTPKKRARRKKPAADHRSKYVQVRVSQNEYDQINGWANEFGVNISLWVRTHLLRASRNGAKSL